ncbi:hypothetical protein CH063_10509 [Colletotrichum higginsianum]|uniref:Uncharacterized protein n=2 Tax=Colletotrichum higginsianum TaxID=80884 RepID=H1VHR5_COLHI|nr:hypothetical protein CH63R_02317 [Colletotrichum higginsianum IMI 349063]OBR13591.1 hypothetical protein CH63R_02317 [Colletotrichum higginsianum IMI 349063]CCF39768.1 hypothetical protein CH063_10509 [Colletotrichum higginsianum]
MRTSTFSLILFTIVSIAIGAIVAATAFGGESVEHQAASSLGIATTTSKMIYTAAATTSVLQMNPLRTINTIKPETIVIKVRTNQLTMTTATSAFPIVECSHKQSLSMCAPVGVTGQVSVKGPVSGDDITSLVRRAQFGDHEVFKTVDHEGLITTTSTSASTATTIDCKYKYCNNNTQYCMYWAGVTGWDPSLGPIPGMTGTSLGACQTKDVTTSGGFPTMTATTKNCTRRAITKTF